MHLDPILKLLLSHMCAWLRVMAQWTDLLLVPAIMPLQMMPSSQVVPSKRQSAGKGSSLGSVVLSPLWDHDPNPQPRGGGGGGGKRPSVSSKPPQRAGQGPKRSVPLSS